MVIFRSTTFVLLLGVGLMGQIYGNITIKDIVNKYENNSSSR